MTTDEAMRRTDSLFAAQERYEKIFHVALRRSRDLTDFGYANPYIGPSEAVLAALHEALDSQQTLALQYTPYGGLRTGRRHCAKQVSVVHGLSYRWSDVALTPGAMSALNVLFSSAASPECDEVIAVVPCWLDYPLYLSTLGLKLVPWPTKDLGALDLERLPSLLGPRTAAVILSQPSNPWGRQYSPDELASLGKILSAAKSKPLLISDEAHRDARPPGLGFVSPAAHYPRTASIFSFGKYHLIQGQRLGYIAVAPDHPEGEALMTTVVRTLRARGFCTPTALMQRAIPALLRAESPVGVLLETKERLRRALEEGGVQIPAAPETYFLFPKAPDGDSWALVQRLADRGVMALPSELFSSSGYIRLSVTCRDEDVDRAIPILCEELVS